MLTSSESKKNCGDCMRVLVTGGSGFVGQYLIDTLTQYGHEVYSFSSQQMDITQPAQVNSTIKELRPEGIVHLAAQSLVRSSWEDPLRTIQINTLGTLQLLMAVKQFAPCAKILMIGTSEEYGLTGKSGIPLKEDEPCRPQNPYAVSKFAAGQVALQVAQKDNLRLIYVRPFNHFGPGQPTGYIVSDFSSQIAAIEQGKANPVLYVGNLTAQRDFSDVRDVVQGYRMLLEQDVPNGIYNICSEVPRSAQFILDSLLQMAAVKIKVAVDEKKLRVSDVPLFIGSAQKIFHAVQWKPQHDFLVSLQDTLNWWRTLNK